MLFVRCQIEEYLKKISSTKILHARNPYKTGQRLGGELQNSNVVVPDWYVKTQRIIWYYRNTN